MNKFEREKLKKLNKKEQKLYFYFEKLLNLVRKSKKLDVQLGNLDYIPIKIKIQNYVSLKKMLKIASIFLIVSLFINIIIFKNINQWTNFSVAMSGFLIFIFNLFMHKLFFVMNKVIYLFASIFNNSIIIILFIVITLLIIYFIKKINHYEK